MKNKIIVVLVIINIVLVGVFYSFSNTNGKLIEEKRVLKEMSTSEREQELDNKITELNTSATEYATYVQSCKAKIANAITDRGVSTNETDTVDVMVENIKKLGNITMPTYACSAKGASIGLTYVDGTIRESGKMRLYCTGVYSGYHGMDNIQITGCNEIGEYTTIQSLPNYGTFGYFDVDVIEGNILSTKVSITTMCNTAILAPSSAGIAWGAHGYTGQSYTAVKDETVRVYLTVFGGCTLSGGRIWNENRINGLQNDNSIQYFSFYDVDLVAGDTITITCNGTNYWATAIIFPIGVYS